MFYNLGTNTSTIYFQFSGLSATDEHLHMAHNLFYWFFVLSLFVPQIFFCRCLGKAVLRDCDIFRVSYLCLIMFISPCYNSYIG